jgi:hypothetical protein
MADGGSGGPQGGGVEGRGRVNVPSCGACVVAWSRGTGRAGPARLVVRPGQATPRPRRPSQRRAAIQVGIVRRFRAAAAARPVGSKR